MLRSNWELWKRELLLLEQMNIPRCFKPDRFGNLQTTELYNFADPSVDGYGQYSCTLELWIVRCSIVVSKLILECTTCRKIRATTQEQKMADLPHDRLEPAPPFSYCGVDYFGRWYVKEGWRWERQIRTVRNILSAIVV